MKSVILQSSTRMMTRKLFAALLCGFLCMFNMQVASGQNDFPDPAPNIENIPAGAYVIPMDNTFQSISGVFNLRAYGLAARLLWNDVHIKWAIKSGKAKDEADFSANATRVYASSAALPALPGRKWDNAGAGGEFVPALAITSSGGGTNSTAGKFNGSASWRLGRGQQITFADVDLTNFKDVKIQVAFASGGAVANIPLVGQNLIMDISYDGVLPG